MLKIFHIKNFATINACQNFVHFSINIEYNTPINF